MHVSVQVHTLLTCTGSRPHIPSKRLQNSLFGKILVLDLKIDNDTVLILDISSRSLSNLEEGMWLLLCITYMCVYLECVYLLCVPHRRVLQKTN